MQTMTYQDSARQLLAQAIEKLAEGRHRQASDKGREAAAQMIKAVASDRGWDHDNHAALFAVIDRLTEETGDTEIHRRFAVVITFYQYFYENWSDSDYVAEGIADIRDLMDKLEPLLESNDDLTDR